MADFVMSVKRHYHRTLPSGEGPRVPVEKFASGALPVQTPEGWSEKCTCWVLLRSEGPQPLGRDTADCELIPDPSCPVHAKKRYPILDDEDWED